MTSDQSLPIEELRPLLKEALSVHSRLIISAPTGSGKSTQIPQMMLDDGALGDGEVVVLQPRRLAARMLAQRVAQERGVSLGGEVGYQIRFEKQISDQTRIRFVTEGILLRQLIQDPSLKGISAIIFDEFHERHLYGDITLGRALDLQAGCRPDLKLVVMSATLEAERLKEYLNPCADLVSKGRTFPVDVKHLTASEVDERMPIWDQAANAFSRYIQAGGKGDVLIFMPGAYEIDKTLQALRHESAAKGHILLPLHGELP
ncbi:MAG: DEAD/DEAH box helicase, partial [Limisphaerales bacterium]